VRLLRYFANEIESGVITIPGFYPEWARPTFMLVKLLVYAFGFIIIFPYLPSSESPIFRGVSVFLGLLFSIGSSSAISNAVAGYLITYMRPFKIGDRIKIGDISGYVVEKSMLVTRVRSIKNEDITIPNSTVLTGYTTNYSRAAAEHGLIINSSVTIGYDAPWQKVHALLIDAALATKGVISEVGKAPFVLQTSLNDFHVSYQINAYTYLSINLESIYSELHQHIQNKFNDAGVEILSPHYRSLRDGNYTMIHKEKKR
jgi:small-conductance mechanosensitive channel